MVRRCRVKVLIAGLQCRDRCHTNELLATSDVSHYVVASQPKEAVTSAGPRVQPGAQFPGPHIFLQTSRRHSVGTCHFFFFSLLLASSELAPSNTWLAGYSSTATSRVLYWAPCSAVASKDCTEPSLRSISLLTLTVQRYFPHKPRMEMAEGESGRL